MGFLGLDFLVENRFAHGIEDMDFRTCLGEVDFEDAVVGVWVHCQAEFGFFLAGHTDDFGIGKCPILDYPLYSEPIGITLFQQARVVLI